jgi:hypothetical protein
VAIVSHSRIVNCDEISWLLHPRCIFTWAPVRVESVQAQINDNEKDCVTVLASVMAAGDKLLLTFLAAGQDLEE